MHGMTLRVRFCEGGGATSGNRHICRHPPWNALFTSNPSPANAKINLFRVEAHASLH